MAMAMLVASTLPVRATPAEPPAGASSCSGCHARKGVDTAVPPLTSRSVSDIVAQMQAFRTGQKPATVMDRIAKGFTDTEVEAIAAWYAQQK
jgi:sulfide dehydrogenase cytochrome subunit